MKEQSHKDEMSKALRGDFARLRGRGVSVTLAPRETTPADSGPIEPAETAVEATPEPEVEPPEAQSAEPEPTDEPPAEPDASDEPQDPEPGWLGRLFGR